MDTIEPRMNGALLVDQMALMEKDYGPEVVERALTRLSQEQQDEIRANVSVSWLDVRTVTAFKTAVAEELGMDPLDFQRRIVRRALGDTVNKLWRILLSQLWDSAIVKRTPILYSKAFDRGALELESIELGHAVFVLRGWPDMPDYDCIGLSTGMEALLDYSGRRGASVAYHRRRPLVVFEATWKARGATS